MSPRLESDAIAAFINELRLERRLLCPPSMKMLPLLPLLIFVACAAEVVSIEPSSRQPPLITNSDLNFYRTLTTPTGATAIAYAGSDQARRLGDVVGAGEEYGLGALHEAWVPIESDGDEPTAVFFSAEQGEGCWATTSSSWQFAAYSSLWDDAYLMHDGYFWDDKGNEHFDPERAWSEEAIRAGLLNSDVPRYAVEVEGCARSGSAHALAFLTEAQYAKRVEPSDTERELLLTAFRESDAFWEAHEAFERSRQKFTPTEASFSEPHIQGWDTEETRYFLLSHNLETEEDTGCGYTFLETVRLFIEVQGRIATVVDVAAPEQVEIVYAEGAWHLVDFAEANASTEAYWEGCSC